VYIVNFFLPLGFCLLNGYWIAVIAACATAAAALLSLASGCKPSPVHARPM
jgi:hypothetical protein